MTEIYRPLAGCGGREEAGLRPCPLLESVKVIPFRGEVTSTSTSKQIIGPLGPTQGLSAQGLGSTGDLELAYLVSEHYNHVKQTLKVGFTPTCTQCTLFCSGLRHRSPGRSSANRSCSIHPQ